MGKGDANMDGDATLDGKWGNGDANMDGEHRWWMQNGEVRMKMWNSAKILCHLFQIFGEKSPSA